MGISDNKLYSNLKNKKKVRLATKPSQTLIVSDEDINRHQELLNDRNLIVGTDI